MSLRRVVAPVTAPVSLAEAKAHLRVDGAAEDVLISAFLGAATDHLDGWSGILGRALVTQTWEMVLDAFPAGSAEITVPLAPVASIVSVTYLDALGVQQTLAPSSYIVDAGSTEARIALAPGASWPATQDRISAVTVRFVAGYGDAAAVPAPIRAAILLMVADLYENREAQTAKALVPNATVDRLLSPYRAQPV